MASDNRTNRKRADMRRPIWTADAETDPFKKGRIPAPFIWGIYTGEEYHEFYSTDDFIDFIADKRVVIYAHNGGKFDWHFITSYIDDYEPLTVIAGRLAKFKIGEAEFRDSYNIIPAPLSAYKKDDFDYTILEPDVRHEPENWRKIQEYLKNDCIYLHEMVTNFIDNYGMNITQASSALKFWSKLSGIKTPKSQPWYYEALSRYYYGGRTECFVKGIIEKPFKVTDIKSAYPWAMTFKHPWGGEYSTYDSLPELPDEDLRQCFITLTAKSLGAFPFRTESGALAFPNDGEIREFHITGWEYLAARDTGTLQEANVTFAYSFLDEIDFTEYVEHFFAMKAKAEKEGDAAGRLFAKIFLNSLYGKFASNPENYEEFMTLPAQFITAADETQGWKYCKLFDEETAVVCRPLPEENHRFYDVAVAASITGCVRAYLWRNICGATGVMYCDTDSIACEDFGAMNIGGELGQWEIEAECDFAAIGGKKLYAFRKLDGKYKTASKGVRLTAKEIIKVAQDEVVEHEPEAPTFTVKGKVQFTARKIRMTEISY